MTKERPLTLKNRLGFYAALLLLTGFFLWNNLEWEKLSFPFWLLTVSSGHLFRSFDLGTALGAAQFGELLRPYGYPPLVYLVSAPFYLRLGYSMETGILSQGVFVLILAFSLFGAGRKLWSPWAGLLAVCLYLSFPGILTLGRYYGLDLPLAAMVCLAFYLYLESEHFSRRGYSLAFGAVFFLGFITRYQMVFYLAGLAVYEGGYFPLKYPARLRGTLLTFAVLGADLLFTLIGIGHSYSPGLLWGVNLGAGLLLFLPALRRSRPAELSNLTAAYFLFLLPLILFMHLGWWAELRSMWQVNFNVEHRGIFPALGSPLIGAEYFRRLPGRFLLGPGMFLAFLAALLFGVFLPRKAGKPAGLLWTALIGGWLFLSLAPVLCPRFLAPLLPFAALLIAGFALGQPRLLRVLLVSLLLLIGFSQAAGWRFPQIFPRARVSGYEAYMEGVSDIIELKETPFEYQFPVDFSEFLSALPPCSEDWKMAEAIGDLEAYPCPRTPKTVLILDDLKNAELLEKRLTPDLFSALNFQYLARLRGIKGLAFKTPSGKAENFDFLLVYRAARPAYPGLKPVKTYFLPRGLKGFLFCRP